MRSGTSSPVHPHVRGDNSGSDAAIGGISGSPPRAWGQRRSGTRYRCRTRFTPTCVGTTLSTAPIRLSTAVHPHVRGDNGLPAQSPPVAAGSPPRAWGQRVHHHTAKPAGRFTPTCVGTTPALALTAPRIYGSPPRAWGQHTPLNVLVLPHRFTPTCVGTTLARGWQRLGSAVHPHVRGDNLLRQPDTVRLGGSPPRAWGQLFVRLHRRVVLRFTPTCVGTTQPACEK